MQSRIFQTLLLTATLGLCIPAENALGSGCDTCVCHPKSNYKIAVGALINTGFHLGSGSCTNACQVIFLRTGANTCYSTGVKVSLPTGIPVIDCSQPVNASKCKG